MAVHIEKAIEIFEHPVHSVSFLVRRRERARHDLGVQRARAALVGAVAAGAFYVSGGMQSTIHLVERLTQGNEPACTEPDTYYEGATALQVVAQVDGVREHNVDLRYVPVRNHLNSQIVPAGTLDRITGEGAFAPSHCE